MLAGEHRNRLPRRGAREERGLRDFGRRDDPLKRAPGGQRASLPQGTTGRSKATAVEACRVTGVIGEQQSAE